MESFESIDLSPQHIKSLEARLAALMSLKTHVQQTIDTFNNYSDVGKNLCTCIENVSKSFKYKEFEYDTTFQNITRLLDSFNEILFDHFDKIKIAIINPLNEFINNVIKKAEDAGKSSSASLDSYNKCLENYVSKKKGKNSQESVENLEAVLMKEHSKAVDELFVFSSLMDLAERKRLIEISSKFVSFICNLSVSFRQCTFEYDFSISEFDILRSSFPEILQRVTKLEKDLGTNRKIVQQQQQLFWSVQKGKFKPTGQIHCEGYLWERVSGFKFTWKKRYVICKDGELSFYEENENKEGNSNKINLLLASPKRENSATRRFVFSLTLSDHSKLFFQAMTEYDMEMWIDVITNNINLLISQTELTLNGSQSCDLLASQSEFIKVKPQSILEKKGNNVCADCGSSVMPIWCCINWGTCICTACSGVHRSLSTSVSKVRGLLLDGLSTYTLRLIYELGNVNANSVLEKNMNDEDRVAGSDLRMDCYTFIKQKYVECKFVDDDVVKSVDMRDAIMRSDLISVFKAICMIRKRHESFFVNKNCSTNNANNESNTESSSTDNNNNNNTNDNDNNSNENNNSQNNNNNFDDKGSNNENNNSQNNNNDDGNSCDNNNNNQNSNNNGSSKNSYNKSNGAKSNDGGEQGYTWLHLAASVGDPLVTLLIAYNIESLNVLDEGGWSPLSYAAFYGNIEAVKVLLQAGSDANLSKVAHPRIVALAKENQKLATLFPGDIGVHNENFSRELKPPFELPADMIKK